MSLQSPTVPTDNLYKTITIGGIALVIGAFLLLWKALDVADQAILQIDEKRVAVEQLIADLRTKSSDARYYYFEVVYAYRERQREAKIENPTSYLTIFDHDPRFERSPIVRPQEWLAAVQFFRDGIKKDVENIQAVKALPEFQRKKSVDELGRVDAILLGMESALTELAVASKDYQSSVVQGSGGSTQTIRYLSVSSVLFLMGFIVSFLGCILWYNCVQYYDDRILLKKSLVKQEGFSEETPQSFRSKIQRCCLAKIVQDNLLDVVLVMIFCCGLMIAAMLWGFAINSNVTLQSHIERFRQVQSD